MTDISKTLKKLDEIAGASNKPATAKKPLNESATSASRPDVSAVLQGIDRVQTRLSEGLAKFKKISEEGDGEKWGVFRKGGSIGDKKNDKPIKTFDSKEEAKEDAARRRKSLSKGEKAYYGLGYTVKQIKKEKTTESVGGMMENYPKHQDLSGISTEKLEAFLKKHTGEGAPTFGQGAQVKRVRAELARRQSTESEMNETAAPGQEAWIKKNKQRFIDQYGKDKGLEVLYATSWKRSKKEESVEEGSVTKTKTGIVHKGSYGTSYDDDTEDSKKSEPAVKRGRGRPKKTDSERSSNNLPWGGNPPKEKDFPLPKYPKDKTRVHRIEEEELDEKWATDYETPASRKGMFKGRDKASIEKELTSLKKSGPHKKGSAAFTKEKELQFAKRAKSHWKNESKELNESRMMDEGRSTLSHILNRFKHEVENFKQGGDLVDDLYDALYDYYLDAGEMPYGIAKARTGDPYQWVHDKFAQDVGELDEGVMGAPSPASLKPQIPAFKRKATGASNWKLTTGDLSAADATKMSSKQGLERLGDKLDTGSLDEERDALNELARLAGLSEAAQVDECLGMESGDQDGLSVSTSYDSRSGRKSVTISADGEQADALVQMLKLAGMHGETYAEPEGGDTDIEVIEPVDEAPEYDNSPDPETENVDAIIHQGTDLNREKQQYHDTPRIGDNPMAEEIDPIKGMGRRLLQVYEQLKLKSGRK
jgi:hypothetical protein